MQLLPKGLILLLVEVTITILPSFCTTSIDHATVQYYTNSKFFLKHVFNKCYCYESLNSTVLGPPYRVELVLHILFENFDCRDYISYFLYRCESLKTLAILSQSNAGPCMHDMLFLCGIPNLFILCGTVWHTEPWCFTLVCLATTPLHPLALHVFIISSHHIHYFLVSSFHTVYSRLTFTQVVITDL